MSSDPQWLNPEEMRTWRAFVEASGRVIQVLDASLKERSDMTFDDYEVLVFLSEADCRRLRMTELGDRLLHSRSRLTQRVDRLVTRGWVCREKCDEDRRGTWAVLTDEGFAAIAEAAPGHVADVRRLLFDPVEGMDLTLLGDAFERIAAAAETEQ